MIQVVVDCTVMGPAPIYRAYLDDELFTERTWRFPPDQYLEEIWQVRARPGRYRLRYELIGNGSITTTNWQILRGDANIDAAGQLVIHDA